MRLVALIYTICLLVACTPNHTRQAENFNRKADSAFVRMDYALADSLSRCAIDMAPKGEVAVEAHLRLMRIAQRVNDDTEFFTHRLMAEKRLHHIKADTRRLRLFRSELHVITSTYLYYMRDDRNSVAEIRKALPYIMPQDTLARISYLYNLSAGGKDTTSFGNLIACYVQSMQCRQPYFTANALQSLATLMADSGAVRVLERCRPGALAFARTLGPPDSMAHQALEMFRSMGDRFQTACVLRTLGELAFARADYGQALQRFRQAYSLATEPGVSRVPLLLMGIHEQLSMTHAMLGDARLGNYHRAAYLDLLAVTRQDREMAGRISTINRQTTVVRAQMAVLVALTLLLCVLVWMVWYYLRRTDRRRLVRLNRALGAARLERAIDAEQDELADAVRMAQMRLVEGKRQAVERRAKVSYLMGILPLVDRLVDALRRGSSGYALELLHGIQHRNSRLTEWIQMRRGRLSLHIHRFDVRQLLHTVWGSAAMHAAKGVTIEIDTDDTPVMAQADRALTLFMLSTLTDNACRYTPEGGKVVLSAHKLADCVEVAVSDTGAGMTPEQIDDIMSRKYVRESAQGGHHGFGLLNCRYIIETYRKMGRRFSVSRFGVESAKSSGTRFFFRIPLACICIFFVTLSQISAQGTGREAELRYHNEAAQRALAQGDMQAYQRHNADFVRLYKQANADPTLENYSRELERSYRLQKILLFVTIVVAAAVLTLLAAIMLRQRLAARRQLGELDERVADLRRQAEYEYQMLHVQNEVLDNCLSAVKHETMYYPARLEQMLSTATADDMMQVARAYREVFVALMAQASAALTHSGLHRQRTTFLGRSLWADADLVDYFDELLPASDYTADLSDDNATIPHLIAKQILRDIDEMNGHPGLKLNNPQ